MTVTRLDIVMFMVNNTEMIVIIFYDICHRFDLCPRCVGVSKLDLVASATWLASPSLLIKFFPTVLGESMLLYLEGHHHHP